MSRSYGINTHSRSMLSQGEDGYREIATAIISTAILSVLGALLFTQYSGVSFTGLVYNIAAMTSQILNTHAPEPLLSSLSAIKHILRLSASGPTSLNPLPTMSKLLLGRSIDYNVPAGLGNFDNSCYQNSILQGLSSLPSVREFFSTMTTECRTLRAESMVEILADLLNSLDDSKSNGMTLWTPQKLKTMDSVNPQDAHEYFGSMMDFTEKEIAKAILDQPGTNGLKELSEPDEDDASREARPKDSDIQPDQKQEISQFRNPLDGLLADRTMCTECGYCEGLRLVNFNCLMTQFPKSFPPWYNFQLGDLLHEYMKLEKVGPTYCAKCTVLQNAEQLERLLEASATNKFGTPDDFTRTARGRLDAIKALIASEDFGENDKNLIKSGIPKKRWAETMKTKQSVIARAPRSLAIHINRSEFDENTWQLRKNTSPVNFPPIQDMSPWVLGGRYASVKDSSEAIQLWKMDPMHSMLPEQEESHYDPDSQLRYELRAVVRHQGFGHHNGHYVCYKKRETPLEESEKADEEPEKRDALEDAHSSHLEQWWSFSDEDVRPQDEQAVLQAPGVFMLFYERITSASPSISAEFVNFKADDDHPVALATGAGDVAGTTEAAEIPTETTDSLANLTNSQVAEPDDSRIPPVVDEADKDTTTVPLSGAPALPVRTAQPVIDIKPPLPDETSVATEPEQSTEGNLIAEQESPPVQMRTAGSPAKRRRKGKTLPMVEPT